MESELLALVAHLEDSWNSADSQSFASVFAEDADFIHILGGHYTGRDSVETAHRTIFDTIYKGSTVKMTVQKIRPLAQDAAVVFVLGELAFSQGGERVTIRTRPTLMVARRAGKWQIEAFQNTPIKEANAAVQERLAADHPFPAGAPNSR